MGCERLRCAEPVLEHVTDILRHLRLGDIVLRTARERNLPEPEAKLLAEMTVYETAVQRLAWSLFAYELASEGAVKGFLDAVADRVSAIRDSPREGGEQ